MKRRIEGFLIGIFLIPVLIIVGLLVMVIAFGLPIICFIKPEIIKLGGERL